MDFPFDTLNELIDLKRRAQDFADAYAEALKAQAEKHAIRLEALRAVVNAAVKDKLPDLEERTVEVLGLLDTLAGEPPA